jgi:hypothetical protein
LYLRPDPHQHGSLAVGRTAGGWFMGEMLRKVTFSYISNYGSEGWGFKSLRARYWIRDSRFIEPSIFD